MRRILFAVCILVPALSFAVDDKAVVGGALGGAVGAGVGAHVGGTQGAIIGGALGGGAGAAIGSDHGSDHHDNDTHHEQPRRHRRHDNGRHLGQKKDHD